MAEYAAAALTLLRGAFLACDTVREGVWSRDRGRRMVLGGFGGIARPVAEKVLALDMTVAAFDPYVGAHDFAVGRSCAARR